MAGYNRDEYSRTPLQANRTWNSCAVARFNMQICSFLPSATEILYALGLEKSVAGVTFECDFPPDAATKTVVVNTNLAEHLTSAEIDHDVNQYSSHGESLYRVDIQKLEAI